MTKHRKHSSTRRLLLLLACQLLTQGTISGQPAHQPPSTLVGQVVAVQDGDTLTVSDDQQQLHKVRLAGIDAPETNQPYGQTARRYLSALVLNANVTVEHHKLDRYQRKVGTVFRNGQDVNVQLLEAGLAWHFTAYEQGQTSAARRLYAQAASRAQADGVGLWQADDPTPPWEWRKQQRSKSKVAPIHHPD
ncbi:MAG TPA: thermonuclease family protein [Burkholderiaceae bacterium]|nr:thermonuclease family protein [Burkholderiaceae bacterium]